MKVLWIDPETHREIKILSAITGKDMKDLAVEMVKLYKNHYKE